MRRKIFLFLIVLFCVAIKIMLKGVKFWGNHKITLSIYYNYLSHFPLVKSGKTTGIEPVAIDCSANTDTAIQVAAS